MKQLFYIFILFGFLSTAQQSATLAAEVAALSKKYDTLWDHKNESIVFTGSSSIRMWQSLKQSFPNKQILNTGFGGSQASDLLYHLEPLVLRYTPRKVFIYEGDNDLWSKKRPNEILFTTRQIIQDIHAVDPTVQIVLMGTKPSISRWKLRGRYKRLNRKLKKMSDQNYLLTYVDVWTPMLTGKKLRKDLFISDGLHMNQKGYDIWYHIIKDLVNQP